MDRRAFLATGAALTLAPRLSFAQARKLRVAAAKQSLVGAQHPATDVWAYNGTVPGPELRFKQGERLRIEVENALGVATTVHWHGIRLPNAMDGVPGVTQKPIPKDGRILYEFDLPDAGTYWYHPHLGNPEQVSRGLYGALIVEERDPPPADRDVVWVLSDWELNHEARIDEEFSSPMAASHDGRIGNSVTLNGGMPESFAVRAGERIRLRLINCASARIFALRFEGHTPMVIAYDGHPVAAHPAARVVLGPGMRVDLMLDCAAQPGSRHRVVDDFYRQSAYELIKLAYRDESPLRQAFPPIGVPAMNPVARPDLAKAARHRVVFGGGAKGAIPNQAAHKGLFWTVNGKPMAEHQHHEPLLQLKLRQSYILELVNDTAWHHPIHLHGHAFRVLPGDRWGDTVLLEPKGRAEIAFIADNPGDWMFHCHVLEHQATGMMALVRVAG